MKDDVRKHFRLNHAVGDVVKFVYDGEVRSGIINFIADRVVNLRCDLRLAFRSFSYDKIQLID